MQKAVHLLCPACGEPFEADRLAAARDALTPTQRRIFDAVRAVPEIQMDHIVDRVWGDDPNGGPMDARQNISVQIANANRRLKPIGLRISASHRGAGATYSIREI
jgi:hypothetical protein